MDRLLSLFRCLALLCLLVVVLPLQPAHAEGVELVQLRPARSEDGLELSFSTRFELPRAVEDALSKGVPVYFVAEVALYRSRWYWRDAKVAQVQRVWRLHWQPLTRQYRVSTGGLNQNFGSLTEALATIRGIAGWRISDAAELDDDGRYYLEFSYKLDTSQLPRPMQIGLAAPQGWNLSVERKLTLNADFSPKVAAP